MLVVIPNSKQFLVGKWILELLELKEVNTILVLLLEEQVRVILILIMLHTLASWTLDLVLIWRPRAVVKT